MLTSSPDLTFQFCAFVQSHIVVLILFVRNATQDSAHDAQPDHYDQENLFRSHWSSSSPVKILNTFLSAIFIS